MREKKKKRENANITYAGPRFRRTHTHGHTDTHTTNCSSVVKALDLLVSSNLSTVNLPLMGPWEKPQVLSSAQLYKN